MIVDILDVSHTFGITCTCQDLTVRHGIDRFGEHLSKGGYDVDHGQVRRLSSTELPPDLS